MKNKKFAKLLISCQDHIPSNITSSSPTDAVNAALQLMLTVKAYKVLTLIVFTVEDVAKNVGSSLVAK